MPHLNMRRSNIFFVSHKDLESYIREMFGVTYDIAVSEELSNDTVYPVEVTGDQLSEYALTKFNSWIEGKLEFYNLVNILNVLSAQGHIPLGQYFVEVSW